MTKREIQSALVVGLVAVMLTWWAATSDYSPVKPKHARCCDSSSVSHGLACGR
jgi:hypothetical protein